MSKDFVQKLKDLNTQMEVLGGKIPKALKGFSALHQGAMADGALDSKFKELIALGIAITVRCDGCIGFHVNDSLKAGATRAEIEETIGVAIMMGGGPSVVYGVEAFTALEQFERKNEL